MKIAAEFPEPRSGVLGAWDRFIGPGATCAELALELISALGGAAAMLIYAVTALPNWNAVQVSVATLLAFDLTGGVVTNATVSAQRWYHRAGQGFKQHFAFVAAHMAHVFIVAALFRAGEWRYALIWSGLLLIATTIVLIAPKYLRRAIALLAVCAALAISLYAFSPTPGLEWFMPVLFLKLLGSHLVE
jgi:hypothetical protein